MKPLSEKAFKHEINRREWFNAYKESDVRDAVQNLKKDFSFEGNEEISSAWLIKKLEKHFGKELTEARR